MIDIWVDENNRLYFQADTPPTGEGEAQLVARLNKELASWGYGFYFTYSQFQTLDVEVFWVEPEFFTDEYWPEEALSDTEVPGWVRVQRIDLEKLTEEQYTTHD